MKELASLTKLLTSCVDSDYSNFYRALYGVPKGSIPNIRTLDDWNLVPTFTKEEVLERPMHEYTFVPHKDIEVVYYTSGTSGKPPAFFGRLAYDGSYNYRKAFYSSPTAILSSIKVQHRSDLFLRDMGSNSWTINFDGKHLSACVALAKVAGVDTLSVHTFTIQAIGEEMKRFGINQNIRLIDFVGETCSLMLYSYMRATFPNATIISFYGMSEAGGNVATPCRPLSDDEPYPIFHTHEDFHIDLIDPITSEALAPQDGLEAEVLISDSSFLRASPLIRYRPGDTVRVVEKKCKAHGKWSFTVLGKTASDFMLIPGGQLRADEIERVLRTMPNEVTDHFELHRYDGGTAEKPLIEVVLRIQPTKTPIDLTALANHIAKELRVAPNHTYADGVKTGIYAPLTCVPLTESDGAKKHRRMFKH